MLPQHPKNIITQLLTVAFVLAVPYGDGRAESESSGQLEVFAAASTTDVVSSIAEEFEARNDVEVELSFAGTSRLARQITRGAEPDVFISANPTWSQYLDKHERLQPGSRRVVAENRLVWAVPDKRPKIGPAEMIELGEEGRLGLAESAVPAGMYAERAMQSKDLFEELQPSIVRGANVRTVLNWLAKASVDAGVVYRTDADAEASVNILFTFSPETHPPIQYEAMRIHGGGGELGEAFVSYLTSSDGRNIWRRYGFRASSNLAGVQKAEKGELSTVEVDVTNVLRRSLLVGLLCVLLAAVPAIGLGWLLARHSFPGKVLVSTAVMVPLTLPPVVTGLLLLEVLGPNGLLGPVFESLGIDLAFSFAGAVVAAFVVGFPLFVMSTRSAFEQLDPRYEEVSKSLGHTPFDTFVRVCLPGAFPGIAGGAVLMFARALGEFGATAVFVGYLEETQTLSLAIYTLLQSPRSGGVRELAIAGVVISFLTLAGYEWLTQKNRGRHES
jgi:molybdate transport system permease protein